MQTLNEVNASIDNGLKSSPPRNITPGGMRTILKAVVQYCYDLTLNKLSAWFIVGSGQPSLNATDTVYRTGRTIIGRDTDNGSGAALQTTTFSVDEINGTPADAFRQLKFSTNPTDGFPTPIRYIPLGELPISTGGTYDFVDLEARVKSWDNTAGRPTHIRLYAANRGTFYAEHSGTYLNNSGAALEAYRQADGRVIVYLRLDNGFKVASVRIGTSSQFTLYVGSPAVSSPVGVQVYDSSDADKYPPYHRVEASGHFSLFVGLITAKIVASGSLPTIGGGASGITPTLNAGSTDMCGTIRLVTNGNPASNASLLTVTFIKPYNKAPRIILTANNAAGASALVTLYPSNVTANGFSLSCGNALSANNTFEINYLVVG